MPFLFLPSLETEEGGRTAALVAGELGQGGAREEGERERRVRGFDPLPRLGRRWSEAAWPRWPAAGGWRRPWAGVLEARRRSRGGGKARGDREGSIPYLSSGWGAAGGSCPRRPVAAAELSAAAAQGARRGS